VCNGTRLIFKELYDNVILAVAVAVAVAVAAGKHEGSEFGSGIGQNFLAF
jgi:hypothetical protein